MVQLLHDGSKIAAKLWSLAIAVITAIAAAAAAAAAVTAIAAAAAGGHPSFFIVSPSSC